MTWSYEAICCWKKLRPIAILKEAGYRQRVDDLDVYSEKSPLGAAVLGAKIGDKVSYTLPNGKTISVEILGAEFFA